MVCNVKCFMFYIRVGNVKYGRWGCMVGGGFVGCGWVGECRVLV